MAARRDVAIILLYDNADRILLQHRTQDARILPGFWAFFGGSLRAHETPRDAVSREAYEELNVRLTDPRLLMTYSFSENGTDVTLHIFMEGIGAGKSKLRLCEGQGWGWFLHDETRPLKMAGRDRGIIAKAYGYLDTHGINERVN